eukprot:4346381-Lingulodinium_polyedra.AAC.1
MVRGLASVRPTSPSGPGLQARPPTSTRPVWPRCSSMVLRTSTGSSSRSGSMEQLRHGWRDGPCPLPATPRYGP